MNIIATRSSKPNNLPLGIGIVLLFLLAGIPAGSATINTIGLLAGAGGLGDQSYNDMAMAGLGKAQQLYNFNLIVQETEGTHASQIKGMQSLIDLGAQVIVANGAGLGNLVMEYSPKFPKILFIVNDFPIEGFANVASTSFAHEEGSYLAGILAASVATTGSIGFIGGVDLPVIHSFLDGFSRGAKSVSETVTITNTFVSPAGDYSGFTNPSQGYALATEMYQNGVEIIFSVAGLTGNGVIQAAREQKKLVIGVDADQDHMAKGYVLTSMMKRLDQSTYLEIEKIMNNSFTAGVTHYGLKNGGVSLSPMRFTRQLVSDEIMATLHQAEKDLISGKIQIPDTM
ncbi:BMP family lipoprotein [Desulfopila aestuarii]|uniref:Basic membrane protein A n=1 Tax=Desulfopila aestuarii DSM 18488 TaxID=1121416 RepID=A0A1M7Y5W4_9BACT|nr:BMP family ABC transporter substrate-binding protein [Desulfopila aestuarii]SHO47952.1 basic membrane protein A [Desulfopila aestuarii DSM 18488]